MSTLEINMEIYRNLGFIADSETYLKQALDALRRIASLKKQATAKSDVKIHLRRESLPTASFVGSIPSDRAADDEAREEYARTKYGI